MRGILKNSVGSGISGAELLVDLCVEVVVAVFRLPVPKGHAKCIEKRTVHVAALFGLRFDLVLRDEVQILRPSPRFQEVLESLTDYGFPVCAGDPFQRREVIVVVLYQELAQCAIPCRFAEMTNSIKLSHCRWEDGDPPAPRRVFKRARCGRRHRRRRRRCRTSTGAGAMGRAKRARRARRSRAE